MLEIKRWADKNNMMIALTPSKDLGGSSVARLKRFYGQFGYKSNKGRNKDFRVMETMVYDPSKNKRASDLDLSLKWDRERLMSKTSEEMEFSDKLFCRSYKDYHKKRDEDARRGLIVRIASLYMRGVMARVSKRDKKDLKNTGHGGLDTWFAGHGGGKPDDRATWGDWIAVTPVKHTITKEDGSKKEYEPGDIVGPCAVSSQKEWSDVTSGGKKPLKCMPRSKAYQMSKDERASLARKKRREENKHRGQKPVNTPTFSDEAKEIRDRAKKKADFNQRILIPDPPKTEELLDELPLISEQYENRFNPSHLQDDLDKGSEHLFATLIESRLGILVSPESIKRVMLDIREPIHHHKNYFNSKRPQSLADEYGIPFQSDYLSSAQTPSYPSGHTTQAYFIAYVLSDKFPSIRVDFFNVANMVAQSRIDRGVHFLSDNESGKILAKALYQERAQTKKKADFYRQVSAPDSLSSYSNGTPVHRHQDGKEESSSLPTGDTARNIGRPSPDSPNLKYRNLDRSESYGRTPANKLDLGYVHDSGSGSARVIPYDSGFENNSSPLRNAHRRISKD
jgi:hypothetical protein